MSLLARCLIARCMRIIIHMSKVAVITGASSGIGLEVAKQLARQGYSLVLNHYAESERTETLLEEMRDVPNDVVVIRADISKESDREKIISNTIEEFNAIDVLVNNAGIYHRTAFSDLTEEQYDQTLNVNLKGALFLTQGFLPYFTAQSSVVFMSSINAFIGSDHGVDYNISKLGMIAVTRSLAQELSPKIRVNAIAPGSIDTNLIASDSPQKRQSRIDSQIIKRMGQPQDIAQMVSFLVSKKASFITGQTFHVNGGRYLS